MHVFRDCLIPILHNSRQLLKLGINRVWFSKHFKQIPELEVLILNIGSDIIEVLGNHLLYHHTEHFINSNL